MAGTGPLAGLTVLDLTRVLSGPYCTMLLADMGARVVKVEQPGRGDDTRQWGPPFVRGESTYFLSVNRNKESVTLDFKRAAGRGILDRLVAGADVLVENFRPGTLTRLGLGYEALEPVHPKLIYCSISGFGQQGPRRAEPGYDAVIQAEGGLMSVTGAPGGPPLRCGIPLADLAAGLLAAQGVLLALIARQQTGRGQHVDISLLDGMVSLLGHHATTYLATGVTPAPTGNRHASIAPYDTFPTADHDLLLAVGTDDQFRRLCAAAGVPALADDGRYHTNPDRVLHHESLRTELAAALRQRTRADWLAMLAEAGVPCGAVRDVGSVLSDPQVLARQMIAAVEHATAGPLHVLGVPIKLSQTPGGVRTAPPALGQHTDAVLRSLQYADEAIAEMRTLGII